MPDENIRVIEVGGHKFEVDLRTAKKIETYRVGTKVKVLKKKYSNDYESFPGIIVGIDGFKKLPTIVIAHIESVFSGDGKVNFVYMNAQTEDVEICPMSEEDVLPNRDTVLGYFDKAISTKQKEIEAIEDRKAYFMRQYGTAFGVAAAEISAATESA